MKKSESVFEVYAHEYDLMTNAAQREKYHAREVAAIIKRFGPVTVLDAGCATGLTTLLLAEQGIEVVGIDKSKTMLAVAQEKALQRNISATFRYGRFEHLPKKLHNSFDLIACLANSISGVETMKGLRDAMKNFYRVLKPGGVLVLQMLNFAAIIEGKLSPIKATENSGIVYERFSERKGKRVFLYVTRADFNKQPVQFEVFRHPFDNFTPDQIEKAVKSAGFSSIKKYADLYFKKRFTNKSHDLVIEAHK